MRLVFLFLICFNFIFAQSDFNKLDANGKKHGIWKGFYEESKRLRYEGKFEHGIEIGVFNFYDDTKAASIIATRTFSENGIIALNVFYDQNKNIVSTGKSINKLNDGEWKYFHKSSSEIQTLEFYVNGKLNGTKKVFYPNNIIAEETNFKDGKKNGTSKIYTIKGIVIEESNYLNDQYNGLAIFSFTNGDIDAKGNFVNGVRNGKWEFYKNGKLFKTEVLPKQRKFAKKKDLK